MDIKITFLGTGTSHGVPTIGCKCSVCISENPKNKRLRSSVFVEVNPAPFNLQCGINILIDTSIDFRQQALKFNLEKVDGVLYTHFHVDHVFGLDELRSFNYIQKSNIKCYGTDITFREIKRIFNYAFQGLDIAGGIPKLDLVYINYNTPFSVSGIEVMPVKLKHGPIWESTGYRIGNFAYLTDCNGIPKESMERLQDLDILVLDTLRRNPHATHFSLSQSLEVAQKLKPKKTFFTHISHDLDHNEINKQLPENIQLAYDGLVLKIY